MERLKHEHEKFTFDAVEFAKNIALTERTLKGTRTFEGWWYYNSSLNEGLLVPRNQHSLKLSSKYACHGLMVKVSLYYVYFKPCKGFNHLKKIRLLEINEQSVEIILYTSQESLDEAWLKKTVAQFNERLSTHKYLWEILSL